MALESLYLRGTQITDVGLSASHGVDGTQVTDVGVAELQKALPNCTILLREPVI